MDMTHRSWYFSCERHHNILFTCRNRKIEHLCIRPQYFIPEFNRLHYMVISNELYHSFVPRLPDGALTVSILQQRLFSVPACCAHGICVILCIKIFTLLVSQRDCTSLWACCWLILSLFCAYSEPP